MFYLIRIAMVIESLHSNKNSNTIINHLKLCEFKDKACLHLEETSTLYLNMFSVLVCFPNCFFAFICFWKLLLLDGAGGWVHIFTLCIGWIYQRQSKGKWSIRRKIHEFIPINVSSLNLKLLEISYFMQVILGCLLFGVKMEDLSTPFVFMLNLFRT